MKYTDRPLTGWGGVIAVSEFFDQLGLRELLKKALPDGRTSNNQVPVVDLIMQFLTTVLIGGKRFQHVDRLREDRTMMRIMKAERFGSGSSLTRYLSNLTPSQGEHIDRVLSELVMTDLFVEVRHDVLDLDSTILQRYGAQEGAARGYNPTRRHGKSHHPLVAMLAHSKTVPHFWLRDGSASPHRGAVEFLQELMAKLPQGFAIDALRADSGFYSRNLMDYLEDLNIPYVIVAKNSRGFTRWCAMQQGWCRVDEKTEVTEAVYISPKSKDRPRRMVITRKLEREETDLFTVRDYQYNALATTWSGTAEQTWRFYRGRGDCENRFRELKGDYNINGFCLERFVGTEVALRLICLLYNLVGIFRRVALRDESLTLGSVRTSVLVVGAALGSSGRDDVIHLGLRRQWKVRFQAVLDAVSSWCSTAAKYKERLASLTIEEPSRWRWRRSPLLSF